MCGAWLVFTYWNQGITIIQVNPDKPEHELHLHSLFLWKDATDTGASWVKANENNLDILNGLIVWTWTNRKDSTGHLITVWWWKNNVVEGNNSWIWGWNGNKINNGDNSAIGWWDGNIINWNSATIAWWQGNTAKESWVVVGWKSNIASNWVALWWSENNAKGKNSLVMWKKSTWGEGSFAWNDGSSSNFNAPDNTARIDANSGVLIRTFTPIKWVALVVSWAIKLGGDTSSDELAWEMRVDNWCIQVYDGGNWHYLGGSCNGAVDWTWCQFGKTYLLNGDTATGYEKPVDAKCSWKPVTCNNWKLQPENLFPYCYEVDTDPEYNTN